MQDILQLNLEKKDDWDWRKHPTEEVMIRTIRTLSFWKTYTRESKYSNYANK